MLCTPRPHTSFPTIAIEQVAPPYHTGRLSPQCKWPIPGATYITTSRHLSHSLTRSPGTHLQRFCEEVALLHVVLPRAGRVHVLNTRVAGLGATVLLNGLWDNSGTERDVSGQQHHGDIQRGMKATPRRNKGRYNGGTRVTNATAAQVIALLGYNNSDASLK